MFLPNFKAIHGAVWMLQTVWESRNEGTSPALKIRLCLLSKHCREEIYCQKAEGKEVLRD
jgi:hypothetical protein